MTIPIQSEQLLENNLVAQLVGQGYAKVAVTDEASMLANLKAQLGAFNGLELTDGEFTKVLHHLNRSAGVFAKAKTLRDRMKLTKEDGETVYLEFFDSRLAPRTNQDRRFAIRHRPQDSKRHHPNHRDPDLQARVAPADVCMTRCVEVASWKFSGRTSRLFS